MSKSQKKLKFIDLFSGIGGFHQAMEDFNGEVVFSSEIDPYAIATYDNNYLKGSKTTSANDITKVSAEDLPDFDVMCGGFPCQAFSKAGRRMGFKDETRGTLFFDVVRIAKVKKPKYILLENVRNLSSHDNGNTWKVIRDNLVSIGYVVPKNPIIISPHHIGIPQLRERVFIPGYFDKKNAGKKWINIDVPKVDKDSLNPNTILEKNVDKESTKLNAYEEMVLNAWDEFYKGIELKVIGFPIWASELNNEGISEELPTWKKNIIAKNKNLYRMNSKFINMWIKKWGVMTNKFTPTHRKMEWQAGSSINSIYDGIIQFRPSGVRVKRPTVFPTLVAMVQTPIIGWKKRRLSTREAANLQSFKKEFIMDERPQQAYKQFGNSINVDVAKYIFKNLLDIAKKS